MSQTIAIPKSLLQNLAERVSRLEAAVFSKKKEPLPNEYVVLSEKAKKRYKKMGEDFRKGKSIYRFKDHEEALKFLLSDKR